VPTISANVNLFDPAFVANPYPTYEDIRKLGRVVWNDAIHAWMIPGYDDSLEVLTDSGDRFAEMNNSELTPWFEGANMIAADGAEHTRLRKCLTPFFTRQSIARWERRVGEIVDELLAPQIAKGSFDIISDFTMIPTIIVAEMMGVPTERYADWQRWSHTIVANLAYGNEDAGAAELIRNVGAEANAYLAEEIERHRKEQPDDLITAMLRMPEMSEVEIRSTALLLVLAGYDTTAKLLGNSLVVLNQHPAQRAALADDLSYLPGAIEEIVRWAGITHLNPRVVVQDTTLGDTDLSAGDTIFLLHSAANRDPDRWNDPLTFDIHRTPKSHIGFGFGAHLCLGAPLARLEAKVALERLLTLAPEYEVRDVEYGIGALVRGPEKGWVDVASVSAA
jgi:cytochrome P450